MEFINDTFECVLQTPAGDEEDVTIFKFDTHKIPVRERTVQHCQACRAIGLSETQTKDSKFRCLILYTLTGIP